MDWRRLFPDSGFRLRMALRPGDAAKFFAIEDATGAILRERTRWAGAEQTHLYIAADATALDALEEFGHTFDSGNFHLDAKRDTFNFGLILHRIFEPDWVLLRADADGVYRLIAGAVCFPSDWALRDKIGKTIDEIHAIVPGLNTTLARQINAFLTKLAPDDAWERENFGFSADAELNHHPSRALKKLIADARLDTTWVRAERQLFYKLPKSGAVAFAIRVVHCRLSELASEPEMAPRLARALETMPTDVANYKGIQAARPALLAQLKQIDAQIQTGERP